MRTTRENYVAGETCIGLGLKPARLVASCSHPATTALLFLASGSHECYLILLCSNCCRLFTSSLVTRPSEVTTRGPVTGLVHIPQRRHFYSWLPALFLPSVLTKQYVLTFNFTRLHSLITPAAQSRGRSSSIFHRWRGKIDSALYYIIAVGITDLHPVWQILIADFDSMKS